MVNIKYVIILYRCYFNPLLIINPLSYIVFKRIVIYYQL